MARRPPGLEQVLDFLTLERKLPCWLAKTAKDVASELDILVEIGSGPIDESDTTRLRDHVRSLDEDPRILVILVDAAPIAPFQSVISVLDALVAAGAESYDFATAAAPGPPPGLRINGVPADAARIPGPPRDHPALRRILSIGE